MLPFLISKTKMLQIRKQKHKEKSCEEKKKKRQCNSSRDKFKGVIATPFSIPPVILTTPCDCALMHVSRIIINYSPKHGRRGASHIALSMSTWGNSEHVERNKIPSIKITKNNNKKDKIIAYDSNDFFKKLEVAKGFMMRIQENLYTLYLKFFFCIFIYLFMLQCQLKALNLGKTIKSKKGETPASQRSKDDKDGEGSEQMALPDDGGKRNIVIIRHLT